LDNALAKADKLGSSFAQLVNETDHIHDLAVRDTTAMDAFADQIITIALHLHHLSESLIRNNESLQLMEAGMANLTAAIVNTTASMEDSIMRYNQNLDLIEQRFSAMLSWMNGTWMLVVGVLIGSWWRVIVQAPLSFHLKIVGIILGKDDYCAHSPHHVHFIKPSANGSAVGTLLALIGVEHVLQPWISSVNLSRVQFENLVLITTLAILCVYWVYRSLGRLAFTRVDEPTLPGVGVP
jgi:hypothetical protein